MSPLGFLPYMNYQQRYDELLNQAMESRLLDQAMKAKRPQKRGISAVMALLGRELSSLGFSMELHYGGPNEPATMPNRQSNPGSCL